MFLCSTYKIMKGKYRHIQYKYCKEKVFGTLPETIRTFSFHGLSLHVNSLFAGITITEFENYKPSL